MTIWLDVTTTLGRQRPVSGIYRVEDALLRGGLGYREETLRFCVFDKDSQSWFEISRPRLQALMSDMDSGTYPIPGASLAAVKADFPRPLPTAGQLGELITPFAAGDSLVSAGLDWDDKDLPLLWQVRNAMGLHVVLFCYDVIPILLPQLCCPGVPEKFQTYFCDAAWTADHILCISENSRRDLEKYLQTVGAPVPPLSVVRLGCDFHVPHAQRVTAEIRELAATRYILFVSTIEARKNHKVLYQAYKSLISCGHRYLPVVCLVGMQGWGVGELMHLLAYDKAVARYFRILNHVSDDDLGFLYEHAYFTVYPSLYEGWGLPVAESLAAGKFCLASSAASIPEIGGELVEYADPQKPQEWAQRLLWYFEHPEEVVQREESIRQEYSAPGWQEFCEAVFVCAQSGGGQPESSRSPLRCPDFDNAPTVENVSAAAG